MPDSAGCALGHSMVRTLSTERAKLEATDQEWWGPGWGEGLAAKGQRGVTGACVWGDSAAT